MDPDHRRACEDRHLRRAVTIGVYGFTLETFLVALDRMGVGLLLDVRQRRGVRGSEYAWANSQRLQAPFCIGPGRGAHRFLDVRSVWAVVKRTLISFYDDQMTHHAAALTYYSLMSLFPAVLLGLSLLVLIGQYPETYDSIIGYLRNVVPESALNPLNTSLRSALQHKGTAVTGLVISVVLTLYGTTGALEAARRALNVVFELEGAGRSFLRRKSIDIAMTFTLMALVLVSLIMLFVGGGFARDIFGFIGLGSTGADIWSVARWPGALAATMLAFAIVYYVTPDVEQRSFRMVTPGAIAGVLLWMIASFGFSTYISQVANVGAIYGAFAGAIILVGWLWLTNVAMLFGAELNAEIERQRELSEGVPMADTLDLPTKG